MTTSCTAAGGPQKGADPTVRFAEMVAYIKSVGRACPLKRIRCPSCKALGKSGDMVDRRTETDYLTFKADAGIVWCRDHHGEVTISPEMLARDPSLFT